MTGTGTPEAYNMAQSEGSARENQKYELWLLNAVTKLLVDALNVLFVDATNVFFGIYGINPGWKLSWVTSNQLVPPVGMHTGQAFVPSDTVTNQRCYDLHLGSHDYSVGATYNVIGDGTMTLNTGGQVFIGQQKPTAGSLEELESHFKRIELSTFDRAISFQTRERGKKGATYHVGTLEGGVVKKTMCVYPRGAVTDKDWKRQLLAQIESLEDATKFPRLAHIYGICRTSFTTAVIYNGALLPIIGELGGLYSPAVFRMLVFDMADYAEGSRYFSTSPGLRRVSTISSRLGSKMKAQYLGVCRYWNRQGYDGRSSFFVQVDTLQLLVKDVAAAQPLADNADGQPHFFKPLDRVEMKLAEGAPLFPEFIVPEIKEFGWINTYYMGESMPPTIKPEES